MPIQNGAIKAIPFGTAHTYMAYISPGGLNAGLAIQQRAVLFEAHISANKISLPQGQSYTEREYCSGS